MIHELSKIKEIVSWSAELKVKGAFRTSKEESTASHVLYVKIVTSDGQVGYGEASPSPQVVGDHHVALKTILDKVYAPRLTGLDIFSLNDIAETLNGISVGDSSLKAAIDIAMHDLRSKYWGEPLWKVLGSSKRELMTDYTISLDAPEVMAENAEKTLKQGFNILKLKLGTSPATDIKRVEEVRRRIGSNAVIRVDANQGWSVKDAIKIAKRLEELDVELVEQPIHAKDIFGLRKVKRATFLPIIADESVHDVNDLGNILQVDAADGINIKLMKSSGITNAIRLAHVARAFGLKIMVGCMLESKVSITAAAIFASAVNADFIDLDSPLILSEDPVVGGIKYTSSKIELPSKVGLGIEKISGEPE